MIEFLLTIAVGLPIWLVLYFGFFGTLDHVIRRGIEDPKIPRYDGLSRTQFKPGPPFKRPTARAMDYYRRP
jgi:hypothetical protein